MPILVIVIGFLVIWLREHNSPFDALVGDYLYVFINFMNFSINNLIIIVVGYHPLNIQAIYGS